MPHQKLSKAELAQVWRDIRLNAALMAIAGEDESTIKFNECMNELDVLRMRLHDHHVGVALEKSNG